MHRPASRVCLLVAVSLLAACQGVPGTPKPAASPGAQPPKPAASAPAPSSATPAPGPIVTTPAPAGVTVAALSGTVRVPAPLLSDRSTGIVSNNGGSLISRTRYHLAGLEQQAAAGLAVTLVDAAGTPVLGPDGQPLATTTDASGRYAFATAPSRGFVVVATLPAERGRFQAVVPPGAAGPDRDVDLVSTLTTGYVLARYVQGQADPLATLDKLTPAVEVDTRTKASAALAGAQVAVPDSLTADNVLATVEALRQRDPAFDAQLEAVRRLLIPVGLSDLGNGEPGTHVAIQVPTNLAAAPDGSLYLPAPGAGRLWRLRPDGTMVSAADKAVTQVLIDRDGRPVLIGSDNLRAWRLEADGKLTDLLTPEQVPAGFLPRGFLMRPDGKLWFLALAREGGATGLYEVVPGQAARVVGQATALEQANMVVNLRALACDANGRITLWTSPGLLGDLAAFQFYTLDPATLALTPQASVPEGFTRLDAHGNRFDFSDGAIALYRPDAPRTVLLEHVPDGLSLGAALLAPGGDAYVVGLARNQGQEAQVFRLHDGQLTAVAGVAATAGDLSALALSLPAAVLPLPGGDLLVADKGVNKVLRVSASQAVSTFAGSGQATPPGADGEAAVGAAIATPIQLRRDAAGNVYVLSAGGPTVNLIHRVGTDGARTTYYLPAAGSLKDLDGQPSGRVQVTDFVVAPDGTAFVAVVVSPLLPTPGAAELLPAVIALDATGKVLREVWRGAPGNTLNTPQAALALAPDGTLYIGANGKLQRATGDPVVTDPFFQYLGFPTVAGALAFDAGGRLYALSGADHTGYFGNLVRRYDLATGAFTLVAGPGAPAFAGSGVNDGLALVAGLSVDASGQVYIADLGHKQIKRLPADAP